MYLNQLPRVIYIYKWYKYSRLHLYVVLKCIKVEGLIKSGMSGKYIFKSRHLSWKSSLSDSIILSEKLREFFVIWLIEKGNLCFKDFYTNRKCQKIPDVWNNIWKEFGYLWCNHFIWNLQIIHKQGMLSGNSLWRLRILII